MNEPGALAFVCPRCRGPLDTAAEQYRCSPCQATYPIVAGIPDFRIAPDPWISLEADRAKGLRLEQETAGQGFETTVRAYWAMTPETPPARAERFITHALHAETRSREWLAALGVPDGPASGERWLDLGCGTADLAAAAASSAEITGLDVAFRWLIVARRRLVERGRLPTLICGNAEALPFPKACFHRVVALGTLEHCQDLDRVLREARRVLRPGGDLHVRTVNRFSALPEPHVGIWGVGWMPRRWADSYVRWRSGERYLHHWPKGPGELRLGMRRAGFVGVRVEAAPMLKTEAERLPSPLRRAAPVYERLRRTPLSATVCRWLAPMLEAEGTAS